MLRAALVLLGITFGISPAYSQVVFKGPSEAKPNKMVIVTLEKVDGDDLKLQGFVNGKPSDAGDWLLMKNLDNQIVIFLMTEKEALYTFVAAVNKGGKTFVTNHILMIGTPTPTPTPNPNPNPQPTTFEMKLRDAYVKTPDPTSLVKLISILEEVSSQNYRSFDDMESIYVATGQRYLPGPELISVRDVLTAELVAQLGTDPRKRDVQKGKDIYKQAVICLKGLQ